jgi:peptide/nickel transport system substrate-binding protein
LLADAGYEDGFTFSLMCPNDRYINDAAVCQAVVGMLAQVGITVDLNTMPVANYWPELREAGNFDMYLLGWSPGTFDHEHPIRFLVSTPNDEERRLGSWNFGGYSNARVDELLPAVQSEVDEGERQACWMRSRRSIRTRWPMCRSIRSRFCGVCAMAWTVTPRSDNFFILRWVSVNDYETVGQGSLQGSLARLLRCSHAGDCCASGFVRSGRRSVVALSLLRTDRCQSGAGVQRG